MWLYLSLKFFWVSRKERGVVSWTRMIPSVNLSSSILFMVFWKLAKVSQYDSAFIVEPLGVKTLSSQSKNTAYVTLFALILVFTFFVCGDSLCFHHSSFFCFGGVMVNASLISNNDFIKKCRTFMRISFKKWHGSFEMITFMVIS